eukprot:TRINITY_DN2386_c0_g1_i1.p1 TRINITY_DN2386_c0_g1~~TRINITY_DN2386_c0_g1_i1.p1  ORF type:complete len:606 (+),score=85.02 TRINITY_DN2386_c0_g1_i1:160-1977(+)
MVEPDMASEPGSQRGSPSISPEATVCKRPVIQIYIGTLMGDVFALRIERNATIDHIKELIFLYQDVPMASQCLLYNHRELHGSQRLNELGIDHGSKLSLVIKCATALTSPPPPEPSLSEMMDDKEVDILDVTDMSNEQRLDIIKTVLEESSDQILLCRDGDRLSLVRLSSPTAAVDTAGRWSPPPLTPTLTLADRLQRVEDNARHRLRMAELKERMSRKKRWRAATRRSSADADKHDEIDDDDDEAYYKPETTRHIQEGDDCDTDDKDSVISAAELASMMAELDLTYLSCDDDDEEDPHHHHHDDDHEPVALRLPHNSTVPSSSLSQDTLAACSPLLPLSPSPKETLNTYSLPRPDPVPPIQPRARPTPTRPTLRTPAPSYTHTHHTLHTSSSSFNLNEQSSAQAAPSLAGSNLSRSSLVMPAPTYPAPPSGELTRPGIAARLRARRLIQASNNHHDDVQRAGQPIDVPNYLRSAPTSISSAATNSNACMQEPPTPTRHRPSMLCEHTPERPSLLPELDIQSRKCDVASASATDATCVKSRKPRCHGCRRKLKLVSTYNCRCGQVFCGTCRNPEAHQCSYDYKTTGRQLLLEAATKVESPRLPKL